MEKEKKQKVVEFLQNQLGKTDNFYFVDISRMNANMLRELRSDIKKEDALIKVAKNNLIRRAFEEKKIDIPEDILKGNNALVFSYSDPLVPARIIKKYIEEENANINVKAIFIEGNFYPGEDFKKFSTIPGRQGLLSILAGSLQGIIGNFVYTLEAKLQEFVLLLESLKKKKEEINGN